VQLHDLARVVFIQAAGAVLILLRPGRHLINHTEGAAPELPPPVPVDRQLGVGAHALPVVQVEEHGRTLGCGHQQVFKPAQDVRADHVALVRRDHVTVGAFVDENVEVVVPEIGHHFVELALAVEGAQQLCLRELAAHHRLRVHDGFDRLLLLRSHALDELRGARAAELPGKIQPLLWAHDQDALVALVRRHLQQGV